MNASKIITIKSLMESDPWSIVENIDNLEYTGDMNFIPHGGTFYDTSNWIEYGYAEAIEISGYEDAILVSERVVNKLADSDYQAALKHCGFEYDIDHGGLMSNGEIIEESVQLQIECTMAYHSEYAGSVQFKDDKNGDPDERAICRHLKSILIQMVRID